MALLTYNQLLTNWAATKTTPVDYFYDASSTYFYGPPDYSTIITPSNVQRVTTANRAAVKGSQTVPGAQAVAPNTPGTNDNYETGGRMFRRGGTEPIVTQPIRTRGYDGEMAATPGSTEKEQG